jgi:hypothetical protein
MKVIFKPHNCGGGFFSQFNQTIQGLSHYYDTINQVEWNMHDTSAFCYNSGDIFKPLFEEYNNNSPSHVTKTIEMFIDQNYTAHLVAEKYTCPEQKQWRNTFNKAYKKFIKHTELVDNTFNEVYENQFKAYKDVPKVGILIRNNSLSTEQPRLVSPTKELYINAINSLNLKEFVLVCAIDNNEDINFFNSKYNTIYNKNTTRSSTAYHNEPHRVDCLNIKDAVNHYLEGFALSKCDYLIHPVSNVATAALYMNPDIKNLFVIG